MKLRNASVLSLSLFGLLTLLVRPCRAQPGPPALDLAFENTAFVSGPAPYVGTAEGVLTGDFNGRLVTRVLDLFPLSPAEIVIKAQLLAYGASPSATTPLLVAEVEGRLVDDSDCILPGPVAEGWLAGEYVTVALSPGDFDLATPSLHRGRIDSWSVKPTRR